VSVLGTQAVLDEYGEDEYLQRCVVDFSFPLGLQDRLDVCDRRARVAVAAIS
jgi:hypothetical protein